MSAQETAIVIGNTIEVSGIDPDAYVMCGGGVLGLCGIREVRDVDLLVKENLFAKLCQDGHTPGGVNLTVNSELDPPNVHIFGQGHPRGQGIVASGTLPLHIKAFAAGQLETLQSMTTHDGLGRPIRHLYLEEVLRRKVFSRRPFEEDRIKDSEDADLIASYLLS